MRILTGLLLCLFSSQMFAQCDDYTDCPCFLKEADRQSKKQNYKEAIFNYLIARDCDPELSDLIKERLVKVFDEINDQKSYAEAQERKAKEALRTAEQQRLFAEKEKNNAQKALDERDRIIDAFYFYEGRFALAYDGYRYGFIDKIGNTLIPYEFQEASPFHQETGYAKVWWRGKKYLLDTLGQKFLLAENLNQLTEETIALDLSNQPLKEFPLSITDYSQLQIIILRNTALRTLPQEIGKLKALQKLNLAQSKIAELPESITQLKNLTVLNLNNNNLRSLPETIGTLTKLSELRLAGNSITNLPKSIGQCQNLHLLNLWGNRLTDLPKSMSQLQNLELLSLSSNQFQQLPTLLWELSGLKVLEFYDCQLQELPEEIQKLQQLEVLLLAKNNLTTLPQSISKLKHLELLILGKDHQIPEEELQQLKKAMPWCTFE